MIINYRDASSQQIEFREKLTKILGERGCSFGDLAKDVGIGLGTLFNFIKYEKPVRYTTLFKINEFLKKQPVK